MGGEPFQTEQLWRVNLWAKRGLNFILDIPACGPGEAIEKVWVLLHPSTRFGYDKGKSWAEPTPEE